ncbi:DHA2 family efflux MFS transporter permease subunit [Dickeya fangzhongdai]|uniref:DHA2 family efflux MFS transporter permease subunit n=1 Tax=Dickeya fangzhongdai TaxID=1778540 RepID=UPI002B316B67|nr:DHA2 family efflux MFS transporter permease subunit [Dickeya fangzhongdai]
MASKENTTISTYLWKVIFIAVIGSFISLLNATIVNVSLSELSSHFSKKISIVQWVSTGYMMAVTLVIPLSGWLVGKFGIKKLYIYCFLGYALTSFFCGISWSIGSLIIFRILQGLFGGLMAPLSQMMLAVNSGRNLAKVSGYAAATIVLAPLLGPLIASVILSYGDWHWLFFLNIPISLIGMVMAFLSLNDDHRDYKVKVFDVYGFVFITFGVSLLLLGINYFPVISGKIAFLSGLALLFVFIFWSKINNENALVDVFLFKNKTFTISSFVQFFLNGIIYSCQIMVPLFLINIMGESPEHLGLMLAPLGVGMILSFVFVAKIINSLGMRKTAFYGACISCLGTVLFSLETSFFALHYSIPVAFALLITGVGQGLIGVPSTTLAYFTISKDKLPSAATSLNILQRLGGPVFSAFCIQFLSTQEARPSNGLAYFYTLTIVSVLSALCALATLLFPKDNR